MSPSRRREGATPALAVVAAEEVAHTVHHYDGAGTGPDGYGVEAADALGVDPARVHKTLVATTAEERLVVAVVPVTSKLDLRALAAAVGTRRAAMADARVAERSTGYVLGGISPLGQRQPLPTVVDGSALDHPTVFVSAGRRGLEIELDPHELVRLTGATVAAIAG